MAVSERDFDNENELQQWYVSNHETFLPGSIQTPGFRITTTSGKGGIPDGFAFDLENREWYVVECELLRHGVWPHIAEQITRFVVAVQNPASLRQIRDRLFGQIESTKSIADASKKLGTSPERLIQQIELFIEAVRPGIVIVIDEINQDLNDFAHALDLPVQIYRVKKLFIDGRTEYYSPDQRPALQTESTDFGETADDDWDVVQQLGGGQLLETTGRFKCYELKDKRVVHIKRSKFHSRQNYYWYGIAPTAMDRIAEFGVTHVVFVMGEAGFVTVPVDLVKTYLKTANTSPNRDGSIRHYHVLISPEPDPAMYCSSETPRFELAEYFQPFE